ncbi:MAG: hypothetical protein V3U54_13305 [Thermodesulfobacteriota bacterium]
MGIVVLAALTGAGVAFVLSIFLLPGMDFLLALIREAFYRARTNWLIKKGVIKIEHRKWEFTGVDIETGVLKMREVLDLNEELDT